MTNSPYLTLVIGSYTILYSAEDEEIISPYRWSIRFAPGNYPYAAARIDGKQVPMHRHILKPPKDMLVDHKNHDTLDNRRGNIRPCTRQQNMWNRKRTCGSSKYKGVSFETSKGKWRAEIYLNNERIYLGRYKSEIDAAKVYNEHAAKLYGEFACLNEVAQ